MRTSGPSRLSVWLCARTQHVTSLLMCHDALSQTRNSAVFPRAPSRAQQSARNGVVMALTGHLSTKRSQGSSVESRNRPWQASALGSGSSFATHCVTSRAGSTVQRWSAGCFTWVHQISSPKLRTQSSCCAARWIRRTHARGWFHPPLHTIYTENALWLEQFARNPSRLAIDRPARHSLGVSTASNRSCRPVQAQCFVNSTDHSMLSVARALPRRTSIAHLKQLPDGVRSAYRPLQSIVARLSANSPSRSSISLSTPRVYPPAKQWSRAGERNSLSPGLLSILVR